MSIAANTGVGNLFEILGLYTRPSKEEVEEKIAQMSDDELRKLNELDQRSWPTLKRAEEGEENSQRYELYKDLHYLFHQLAGVFSDLSIDEQLAAYDMRDLAADFALGKEDGKKVSFESLARATAVLDKMKPKKGQRFVHREDLYQPARKFLSQFAGDNLFDLQLAENLMQINKSKEVSAEQGNIAAKLLEALIAKVEGRTITVSQADYKAMEDLIDEKFSNHYKAGDAAAAKAFDLLNFLQAKVVEEYSDYDKLAKVESTFITNIDHPLSGIDLIPAVVNSLRAIVPSNLEYLAKLSTRIQEPDDYDKYLGLFLSGLDIGRDLEDSYDANLGLMIRLVEANQNGHVLKLGSTEERKSLEAWAQKTFAPAYQDGILLAKYALELVEKVKIA